MIYTLPLSALADMTCFLKGISGRVDHASRRGSYSKTVEVAGPVSEFVPPKTYILPSNATAAAPHLASGMLTFFVQVSVAGSYASTAGVDIAGVAIAKVKINPPSVKTFPSITHEERAYLAVGISVFLLHVPAAGSYSSTVGKEMRSKVTGL